MQDTGESRLGLLRWTSWGGFVATFVGIPLLIFLSRPFAPRFIVLGIPFLAVLLALASRRMSTRVLVASGAVYAAVAAIGLATMYGGYQRSDYGQALAAVRAEALSTDGVILNGPWQDLLYRRYGVGLPPGQIIASTVPLSSDESVGWLQRITGEHPRVWVIDSASDAADPTGVVAAWLDAYAFPRPVIEYQKAVVRPYLTEVGPVLTPRPLDETALGVHFTAAAMDEWTPRRGAESRLRIDGTTLEPAVAGAERRAVVDLLAPDGTSAWHWDGPLAASGDRVSYRATIVVPAEQPTGTYRLRVTPYEASGSHGGRRVQAIAAPFDAGGMEIR